MMKRRFEANLTKTPLVSLLGVFWRFQDQTGRLADVSLEREALRKAMGGALRNQASLTAMPESLAPEGRRFGRMVAFVGVGFGSRAIDPSSVNWWKGDFDESKHPRWPAGTPNQGGEFRPKDEPSAGDPIETPTVTTASESPLVTGISDDNVIQSQVVSNLMRKVERRSARKLARTRLAAARRAMIGLGADAVPGFGEIVDSYEVAQAVQDFEELHVEANAAIAYARGGPKALDALRVSLEDEAFTSPEAFVKENAEKRFGPAGEGYDYHHIVWKGGLNAKNIPATMLNSTENMIRMPRFLHEEITAAYAQDSKIPGLTIREWLDTEPYEMQRAVGIKIMREMGIIK